MTHIYIVGYPKSGNTWLARMIAKTTRLPVKSVESDGTEVAADVNNEIAMDGIPANGCVFKLHDTPGDFESRLIREASLKRVKVIFIYRDIEDVFISSFFYFKRGSIEKYIEIPGKPARFLNPVWLTQRIRWRMRLNRYLNFFIRHGYAKDSTTYAHHLSSWLSYLGSCDDRFDYAVARYEELIANPALSLGKISHSIGYRQLDMNMPEQIAKSESFSVRKDKIMTSNELTFGKEFNSRFLRSGKAGDYKRFLTRRQTTRLRKSVRNIPDRP